MKRILLTTVSLGVLGLVSPALGADLPTYTKAPALATPVYDWSGFYVGAFGGGGWGNHNVNNALGPNTSFANYTANYPSQGGMGGGEAGYNFQSGSVVVGIEATGFWSNINGSDAVAVGQGLFANVAAVDADSLRWGGTLRARGGVTVDRLMLFFTGGWAFGDIAHTNTAVGLPAIQDQFTVHANGLVAGGGIAYALTNNLIGKVEYSYYNFNGYNRPAVGGTGLTSNGQLPYTTESTYSVITVGLDYKFGGPVVARY
jgi:outer membrane immunogenic protein